MSTVFLSAGDASGELHAAALVEAIRRVAPETRCVGLGGPAMAKAGVELIVDQHELAIGGIVGVFEDLPRIVRAWFRLTRALREIRPDLLVVVDSPDFNLPFARRARKLGIPVFAYISPQVWAWRRGRIRRIAERVSRMAVIFPFEPAVYAGSGLPVEFVGHPLVDRLRSSDAGEGRATARRALGLAAERPYALLLPGSRRNEVRRTLPLQLEAASALHALDPRVGFLIGLAPSIERALVDEAIARAKLPSLLELVVVESRTYEAIRAADVALAKPGTATVEIALLGTPLVVATKVSAFEAFVARRLIRVASFSMPNLIAGGPVVPEFLQEEAEPGRVAEALLGLLRGPAREQQLAALAQVRRELGEGGAAERAAAIALEMIRGRGAA